MDNLLKLAEADGAFFRILQITDTHLFASDTHLFASKEATLLGVNTWGSYQSVLKAIEPKATDIDLIIATGDLAQDQSALAYKHFIEGIARFSAPCVWVPGNHDFLPTMAATLKNDNVRRSKQVLIGERWQLVLLNSQVPGEAWGELSDDELSWFDNALAQFPERRSLIALHHHPLPSGCNWLDQSGLRNTARLEAKLAPYPLARTAVCGHIHQSLSLDWHGRHIFATPSTCVQFKPYCGNFTIDATHPGWRWLTLYPDGQIESRVERLKIPNFSPDLTSAGY